MSKKVAVIGIIDQKGGGGKTTIAINLAVATARQNLAAVIIDLDQQTNSTKWRDRRKSDPWIYNEKMVEQEGFEPSRKPRKSK